LVLLKDKAGLKYKEISGISVFSNLSFSSLRELYKKRGQPRSRRKKSLKSLISQLLLTDEKKGDRRKF